MSQLYSYEFTQIPQITLNGSNLLINYLSTLKPQFYCLNQGYWVPLPSAIETVPESGEWQTSVDVSILPDLTSFKAVVDGIESETVDYMVRETTMGVAITNNGLLSTTEPGNYIVVVIDVLTGLTSQAIVTVEYLPPYSPYYYEADEMAGGHMAGEDYGNSQIGADYGMCGTFMAGELPAGTYFGKNIKMEVKGDLVIKYSKEVGLDLMGDLTTKYSKRAGMEVVFDVVKLERIIELLARHVGIELHAKDVSDIKLIPKDNTQLLIKAKLVEIPELKTRQIIEIDLKGRG